MYCILVTGIPAAGKSTMARALSEMLHLPVISKDDIKELMFDQLGFQSREEKVQQGRVDTTDWKNVDYGLLLWLIREWIEPNGE